MSYTDFSYDPFMASLTVKKIGKAKDILTLRNIQITPKTEDNKTYDLPKTKNTFNTIEKSVCTLDDDMWYSDLVNIARGRDYHWYNFPQRYTCTLEGDKSCSFGTIEGKCKSTTCKRTLINSSADDNGDWGFYNNKNGSPESDSTWAWINCTYTYDFSKYDTSKQVQLLQWIKEVYDTLKAKTPKTIWIGPLGNTSMNKWQAYNHYNKGQEYNDLNEAKRIVEEAGDRANSIIINNEGTKYQIREGGAVEVPDDAGFGQRVYTKKVNKDINIANIFRITNIIYAPITDIFNMMYETDYYSEHKELSSFRNNCKYLRTDTFLNWKKEYLTFWTESTRLLYENSITPPNLNSSLENIIDLPLIEKKEENSFEIFKISLTLSYSQLKKYNENKNKDDFISDLLTNFFRDKEAKLFLNRNPVNITTPLVVNSNIDFYTIINLETFKTEKKFPEQFPIIGNNKYFFATAQISATISQWRDRKSVV